MFLWSDLNGVHLHKMKTEQIIVFFKNCLKVFKWCDLWCFTKHRRKSSCSLAATSLDELVSVVLFADAKSENWMIFTEGGDTSGKSDSYRAPIWPLAAFLMLPKRTTEWTFNSSIAVSHFEDFTLQRLHFFVRVCYRGGLISEKQPLCSNVRNKLQYLCLLWNNSQF